MESERSVYSINFDREVLELFKLCGYIDGRSHQVIKDKNMSALVNEAVKKYLIDKGPGSILLKATMGYCRHVLLELQRKRNAIEGDIGLYADKMTILKEELQKSTKTAEKKANI